MLHPRRYFADVCRHLDLEELMDDQRISTAEELLANASEEASETDRLFWPPTCAGGFRAQLADLEPPRGSPGPPGGSHPLDSATPRPYFLHCTNFVYFLAICDRT